LLLAELGRFEGTYGSGKMTDLVSRLRERSGHAGHGKLYQEAADTLEAKDAERARLRAALEEIAKCGECPICYERARKALEEK
jgi:hypothetical protein